MADKSAYLLLITLLLTSISFLQSAAYLPFQSPPSASFSPEIVEVQELLWNKSLGNSDSNVHEEGWSLVECDDMGFAIAGVNYSSPNIDEDVLLIRTDRDGNFLWSHNYGIHDLLKVELGFSVVECYDGGYAIAGLLRNTTSDYMLLIRTNSDGELRWMKIFGNSSAPDFGLSLVECSDHGFAIAGSTFNFGAEYGDVWVVRTDIQGNLLWDAVIGDVNTEYGWAMTGCRSDGGFAIAGHRKLDGFYDVQLVRLNSTGGHLWTKYYDHKNYEYSEGIIECANGDLAIVGYTCDVLYPPWFEPLLLRIDPDGNLLWNHSYIDIMGGLGTAVVEYSGGGFAITASTTGSGVNKNAWLIRTNNTGHLEQVHGYGLAYQVQAFSLTECVEGGLAFTGYINRTTSESGRDVWLVRLPDDVPPAWVNPPIDQYVGFGFPFIYALEAQDPQGLDTWHLFESPLFTIDEAGVITNAYPLPIGVHRVQVAVNDSCGNVLHGTFHIVVILTPLKLVMLAGIAGIAIALVIAVVKKGVSRKARATFLLLITALFVIIALSLAFFLLSV
jgi:hypothetical protein